MSGRDEIAFAPVAIEDLAIEYQIEVAEPTGAAVIRVPLPLTTGRDGFGPSLALEYRSNGGNSPFGAGWQLSGLPAIGVDTARRLPRYDGTDHYVHNGDPLVPELQQHPDGGWQPRVEDRGGFRVGYYRHTVARSQVRLERWQEKATGRVHWRSRDAENVLTVYGTGDAARIANGHAVYLWLAEGQFDPKGNAIRYEYVPEDGAGIDRSSAFEASRGEVGEYSQRYLKRIQYGNSVPLASPDAEAAGNSWRFEVLFDYGDEGGEQTPALGGPGGWPERPDPFSTCRAGFEVRTYRLCRRIVMLHNFAELGPAPVPVASTSLEHHLDPADTTLTGIGHTGYRHEADGRVSSRSVPSLTFEYSAPAIGSTFEAAPAETVENVPRGLSGSAYGWVDLYGEGLPGILTQTADAWYFKRNLGGGRFAPQEPIDQRPAALTHTFSDFDRDGNPDLVLLSSRQAGFYELDRQSARWQGYRTFRALPHVESAGTAVQWLDLDGDGRSEILVGEPGALTWYQSRGKDGFASPTGSVSTAAGAPFIGENADLRLFLADMTGDGLPDQVRAGNGRVEYWPQLGNGRFGDAIVMEGAPLFAPDTEFEPERLRLVDLDGSGTADLVYIGDGEVRCWTNASGNSLIEGPHLTGLPFVDNVSSAGVLDFLGNGTPCLVWSTPVLGGAGPLQYLPLNGPLPPHLLLSIANGLGRQTRLSYTTSASEYLRDLEDGRGWTTKLPAHVVVVQSMEEIDQIAETRSERRYEYHDGYFDGDEGLFRGFGRVDVYDAWEGSPAATPDTTALLTRSWYHTGAPPWQRNFEIDAYQLDADEPAQPAERFEDGAALTSGEYLCGLRALTGEPIRRELFGLDGAGRPLAHPYQVERGSNALRRLQSATPYHDAAFIYYLEQHLTTTYEQEPGDPRVQHTVALAVDDHNSTQLEYSIAYRRRGSTPIDAQARSVVTLSQRDLVNFDAPDRFEIGVPVAEREYEVSGLEADGAAIHTPEVLRRQLLPLLPVALPFDAPFSGGVQARLLEWHRHYYWDEAGAAPLQLASIGSPALLHHDEDACFPDSLVSEIFAGRIDAAALGGDLGYSASDGYWWQQQRVCTYDAGQFFNVVREERGDGSASTFRADPYGLATVEAVDPLGNHTTAEIDYHVVAPWRITDANGNVREVRYNPLGVIVVATDYGNVQAADGSAAAYGQEPLAGYVEQPDATIAAVLADPGRFLQGAGSFICYQIDGWGSGASPPAALTLQRRELVHDGAGGGTPNGPVQIAISYRDGFGRVAQSKLRVEAGPAVQRDAAGRVILDAAGLPVAADSGERWLVSGAVVYDRKQQPVRRYEPFFSSVAAFEPAAVLAGFGVSQETVYDPLGRPVRENMPNGSHAITQYGAWSVERGDANDTVNDSLYRVYRELLPDSDPEKQALRKAMAHANTPATVLLGPSGLEIGLIERDSSRGERVSGRRLDSRGNLLALVDARGLTAFTYRHDMQARLLFTSSVDAGETWTLPDAFDRAAHEWNGRGVHLRRHFDGLDRPLTVTLDDTTGSGEVVEQNIYGEDASIAEAALHNLRGALAIQRDQAGELAIQQCDISGEVLRSERRLRQEYRAEVDWRDPGAVALEPDRFVTSSAFDALGRPITRRLADGSLLRYEYLDAGGVMRVRFGAADGSLPEMEILSAAAFNARNQRTLALLGNGVRVERSYDRETFRLQRLRASLQTGGATGRVLQDVAYTYDPVGNVVLSDDQAQEPEGGALPVIQGLQAPAACDYTYDAFYQLTRATGRSHRALSQNDYRPDGGGFRGSRRLSLNDGQAVERYARTYDYDAAGNLQRIHHLASSQWTTALATSATSNRSLPVNGALSVNPDSGFDAGGNCIALPHLRAIDWSYRGTLARAVVIDRSGTGQPDDAEYYVYDADGRRVRKVRERLVAGAVEITEKIYLEDCEIRRVRQGNNLILERLTTHISDGEQRVACVHRWTVDALKRETDDPNQTRVHYSLTNHLASAVLELDGQGALISYEEYFPFGGTAFIAGDDEREVALKEYRYAGKEWDGATGFYDYGYRYYAPWLGRWLSPDPLGAQDGLNLYQYVENNPVTLIDPDGLQVSRDRPPIGYIPWSRVPASLQTEQNRGLRFYVVFGPPGTESSNRVIRASITRLRAEAVALAREVGGSVGLFDPRFERALQSGKFTGDEAAVFSEILSSTAATPALKEEEKSASENRRRTSASTESGTGGQGKAEGPQGTPAESDGKGRSRDPASSGVHGADGSSRQQTKAEDQGTGRGRSGEGRGATTQTGPQPGAPSGQGAEQQTGAGTGSGDRPNGRGDSQENTGLRVQTPPTGPPPGLDGGDRTRGQGSDLPPSSGIQPAPPNLTQNGEDPDGNLLGRRNGAGNDSRRPAEGAGTNAQGAPTGLRGSTGFRATGAYGTPLDAALAISHLRFGENKRGIEGGIPGGFGLLSFKPSVALKAAFLALAALPFLRLVKAAGPLLQGTASKVLSAVQWPYYRLLLWRHGVSQKSIVAALQNFSDPAARLTRRALAQGITKIRFRTGGPATAKGWVDYWPKREINISMEHLVSLLRTGTAKASALGTAVHESVHITQRLTPQIYHKGHEVVAFVRQAAVDPFFRHANVGEVVKFVNRAYRNVRPAPPTFRLPTNLPP